MRRRTFITASLAAGFASLLGANRYPGSALAQSTPENTPITTNPDGLTKYVAEFCTNTKFQDIPQHVMELGKKSILDGLGLAIFGATQKTWQILHEYTKEFQGLPLGTIVIGTSVKLPSRFAAFANGVAVHVSDYDDTQLASGRDRVYGLLTHPTVPVLPAALAVGELKQSTGKDLLLAYQLGVEVECKIAEAISPRHYEDGFHSTGTCGVFGSAIAVSKMRGFSVEETQRAMGIAGSQAAGLRENFGTMMKPFHAGHAAEVGVVSGDLLALGWTATDKILEAPRGFFKAYGGTYDIDAIFHKLGKPWTIANPGISIKPFPSGSLTHPAMGEVLRLVKLHDIHPEQVELIEVGTNKNMPNALIHHRPTDELQAKFSMEFCVAILVLDRKAGLREFTKSVVNRRDVQSMIKKVRFEVNPIAEASGYDKMTSIIKIHLKNGTVYSGRADFAKGSPSNPMTYEEVAEKFYGCCDAAGWPIDKAKAIVGTVKTLDKVHNIRALSSLCSRQVMNGEDK